MVVFAYLSLLIFSLVAFLNHLLTFAIELNDTSATQAFVQIRKSDDRTLVKGNATVSKRHDH